MSLDDKTEKIALLEQELKGKENKVLSMENIVAELRSKVK